VQVLSALCTRTANSQPLLQADSMPEVLQAVLGGLQSLCSGGARIEEDKQHSELYAALIKLLSVVLGEVGGAGYCNILRKTWVLRGGQCADVCPPAAACPSRRCDRGQAMQVSLAIPAGVAAWQVHICHAPGHARSSNS
jgi:hypothetical protein